MQRNKKLEEAIALAISRSPKKKQDPLHSLSTRKWVLKLKPNADYALQIAALAHDIDRAYGEGKKPIENFAYYDYHKKIHAQRSAKIIEKLLKKYHLSQKFIDRVKFLVERHEIGGDPDSDILKDADSLSFFENNIYFYFQEYGPKKLEEKIAYMFKRVSPRTQKLIKNFKFKDSKIENIFKKFINKDKDLKTSTE